MKNPQSLPVYSNSQGIISQAVGICTLSQDRQNNTFPTQDSNTVCIRFLVLLMASAIFIAGCDERSSRPEKLIFAGKIVNKATNVRLNGRLVVACLRDEEIGRCVSATSEFPSLEMGHDVPGSDGIQDGVFYITAPNNYGLFPTQLDHPVLWQSSMAAQGLRLDSAGLFEKKRGDGYSFVSLWIGNIEEGETRNIQVKDKGLTYVVIVFPGDFSTLPEQLRTGNVELRNNKPIVSSLDKVSANPTSDSHAIRTIGYGERHDTNAIEKVILAVCNRNGATRVSSTQKLSKTYIKTVETMNGFRVGIEVPVLSWLKLVAAVEEKQTLLNGEVITENSEVTAIAEPGMCVSYELVWAEVWKVGAAEFEGAGHRLVVPFRVKMHLISYVKASQALTTCTHSPSPTAWIMPPQGAR